MPRSGSVVGPAKDALVETLARYFPNAIATRIPVEVEVARSHRFPSQTISNGSGLSATGKIPLGPETEKTVIEFGTAREVIFACRLPLEFEDRIWLRTHDGSLDAGATVVAVQMNDGRTVVAARFTSKVKNWIVRPNTRAGEE
ncbi:MAG: hypothetical protein HYX26_10915 [Acidobacteriales bacterium]|nr:hypothetical protein [Terriglobales bacterium]